MQARMPHGCKTLRAHITIATLKMNGGGMLQTREKWQHIDQLLRNKKVGILTVSVATASACSWLKSQLS